MDGLQGSPEVVHTFTETKHCGTVGEILLRNNHINSNMWHCLCSKEKGSAVISLASHTLRRKRKGLVMLKLIRCCQGMQFGTAVVIRC